MVNKKGNIIDILWFTLAFFGVALIVLTLSLAQSEFNTAVQAGNFSSDAQTSVQTYTDKQTDAWDSGLVLAFIGGHIAIIFLGVMLRSHPMLFMILWLGMILVLMLAGILSNAYDDVAGDASLSAIDAEYPMLGWLLDNYVLATLVMAFIDLLAFVSISSLIEGGGAI